MTVRERPVGRYGTGTPRGTRRWRYWTLLAAFVVAGLVVAYVGYVNLGSDPFDPEVTAYTVLPGNAVKIDVDVTRDHPERAADCILRARSADGDETGRREVYVPPGNPTVHVSAVLHTSKRPVSGEVYGCSYQVPAYLSKTTPPSG